MSNDTLDGALANADQRLVEERALGIFASAEIAVAKQETLALFRADRNAQLADQDALIRNSVEEHFFHASLVAANETPQSPRFVWSIALDHDWMGLSVPASRFGQDNPDNAYRLSTIDPACSYRITGRFLPQPPHQFSICALPGQIGDNMIAEVVGFIGMNNIDVAADGGFAIVADGTPSEGRRNHLSLAGARTLMVRDTLADWAVERPSVLRIERTDGPRQDDFDPNQVAVRAAELGKTIAAHFLKHIQHGMFEVEPVNVIPEPVPSGARGGLVTQCATGGYYRLGAKEALVLTADLLGAGYLGVQIIDMWMISFDYRDRISCLNDRQTIRDADGKYRWVISASDPGVHNWLDGGGSAVGSILLRWQELPPGVDLKGCVTAEVVCLEDLASHLPAGTRFVDPAAREAQHAERRRQYELRTK